MFIAKWIQTSILVWDFITKISLWFQLALYLCSHELRGNETHNGMVWYGMDFILVILTEMKFKTSMTFSCEQNLPEVKWIRADSLAIMFNLHVHLKLIIVGMDFILIILTEMKFYIRDKISCNEMPKHMCPSKYCVGWNAAEIKYVNRTCFHIGSKS